MLIFGHRFIQSDDFYHIQSIEAVLKSPPSSTIYLDFEEDNLDIINHLKDHEIQFAINVKNIREVIYASSLDASYIVIEQKLSKSANDIANNYLFDAKILVHISHEEEIEKLAIIGVDGVIFTNSIIKINS
ncbi:MAG: hypothetical protein U9N02_08710 [Campylobacterota bacterium]|nr:hypothetical protein [Campylobacterota bacterium]